MLSPRTRATGSPPTNSRPMTNAWARPSGTAARRRRARCPTAQPSPSSSRNRGRSLGRRDDQDLADARQHQDAERVVDHRLVVDRQQLLADDPGQRVEPRARAAGQDDPLHRGRRPAVHDEPPARAAPAGSRRTGRRGTSPRSPGTRRRSAAGRSRTSRAAASPARARSCRRRWRSAGRGPGGRRRT